MKKTLLLTPVLLGTMFAQNQAIDDRAHTFSKPIVFNNSVNFNGNATFGSVTINGTCSGSGCGVTTGVANTFTQPQTLDAILKSPYADVRAFGAKGDCATDDTSAIQAALDASANRRAVLLEVPPGGCYKYSATLLMNSGNALVCLNGLQGVPGACELDYYGADATHGIAQKANSSTTDTSKISIIGIRLIDKRTGATSGDGIHLERTVNGSEISENLVSGWAGNNIYFGAPTGNAGDVVRIRDNWVPNFGSHGVQVERLNNNVVVEGTRCDEAVGLSGTACVYITNIGISPAPAVISVRDTKGEIHNNAHLIWADSSWGALHVENAIISGVGTGIGGDVLHITGALNGQSITAENLAGGSRCVNIVSVAATSNAVACSAGSRIPFWTSGQDGLFFGASTLVGQYSATNTWTLPNKSGTVAMTSDIPVVTSTPSILHGNCAGVATSSSTIAMFMLGQGNTSACTGVASNGGAVFMPSAGTLKNLRVIAATAGVNASSGACSVYVNGTVSALTVTLGTSTSLQSDTTHTVSVAAADAVSVRCTTQTSETLGNISATLEKQ